MQMAVQMRRIAEAAAAADSADSADPMTRTYRRPAQTLSDSVTPSHTFDWLLTRATFFARPMSRPTFNTLARENSFRNPQKNGSTYSILNEFVTPHIESFNSLFDDFGLPSGDGDGRGILSLALKDIGERTVFDGNGTDGWGNRMKSTSVYTSNLHLLTDSPSLD